MTWPTRALGDLCSPKQWKALPKTQMTDSGYPVYGANGIIGFAPVFTHSEPTILVGCRGSIGTVHVSNGKVYATSNAMALDQLRADLVELGFLARFLTWRGFHDATSGTSQPQLTRQNMLPIEVPLPPLEEQRRIAAMLDTADALYAKRRQALAHFGELTRSIFFEMFGDPERNTHKLPQRPLGSVAAIVTGNTPPRSVPGNYGAEVEWIKSDNLGQLIATEAQERLSTAGRAIARIAPAGSILVTCIAGSPNSIGKASLTDREVAFNQQINAILPGDSVLARFVLEQLRISPGLVRAKSTGGMKGLVNKSSFSDIEILVPSMTLQREFEVRVAAVDRAMRHYEDNASEISHLFDSLRTRAFSGQI